MKLLLTVNGMELIQCGKNGTVQTIPNAVSIVPGLTINGNIVKLIIM
jgi:hypothetical protein